MQRTNVYLDSEQLTTMRRLARQRGQSVALLVRSAIDEWLAAQQVRKLSDDEWRERFAALLGRDDPDAPLFPDGGHGRVAADVAAAIRQVRRDGHASRD
jgi:predicted transcriptional regulator